MPVGQWFDASADRARRSTRRRPLASDRRWFALATIVIVAITVVAIADLSRLAGRSGSVPSRPVVLDPLVSRPAVSETTMKRQFCAYSAHKISELDDFERLIGAPVDCALVFNSTNRTWGEWSDPWFLHSPGDPDYAWPQWVGARPGRRLIITTSLSPTSGVPSNWLQLGAQGAYEAHARRLAENLVAAGLGHSVIRLSHEANGTTNHDRVPDDARGQSDWRALWSNTVTAMRSVRGADFTFDWAVNYQVRPDISLSSFYPGDQYVDIVGLDAYDENSLSLNGRFEFQKTRAGGIDDVLAFAKAHGKPVSFPEWGLLPVDSALRGGGDQPDYISGMARTIAGNDVAYSGYWYAHADTRNLIENSRASLEALRHHFGLFGDARNVGGS